MSRAINFSKPALAASCLAIAVCGGNSSAAAASSTSGSASSVKAAVLVAASPNGTQIPAASKITDIGGNVWTLSGGVVSENGKLAGHTAGVTLLLFDNNVVYQQSAGDSWSSWDGGAWVSHSGDPRKTPSLSGSSIPTASQITDSSGNVWAVVGGVVYKNGALAAYSAGVTLLLYDNGNLYQLYSGGSWWSWQGTGWALSSDPRKKASPNGTEIPALSQITDGSGNVWTLAGGRVYANGALAGYSSGVTRLVYDQNVIYQEYSGGGWWSWTGSAWRSNKAPAIGLTPPTLSGSPTTADLVGQSYSFVPRATNPGGGTLTFSIQNLPAWASFSTVTGALTGTPSSAQAGVYSNVVISASNGNASASLAAFSIKVTMGSASISWMPPMDNTDGTPLVDLAGYTIYYGASAETLTQSIQLSDASATSYVVGNLTAGTYYFAVAANATDGSQSTRSSAAAMTVL